MEEQLRVSVEPRRDRCMTRRGPAPGRLQQRLGLLAVRAEHMVGDRDSDPIGGRTEIVTGVEEPVSPVLSRAEGPLDQMAFPVEVVGQHDCQFADQRPPVVGNPLRPHRGRHRVDDRLGEAIVDQRLLHPLPVPVAASMIPFIRKKRSIGRPRIGPRNDRRREGRAELVLLAVEQLLDQLRMLAQKHRQRARPDAVAVVLPEQIARAVGVDEDVAVDHAAGHRAVRRFR